MPTLETLLKQQVKQYLKLKGIFYWHNLAGIGVYPGIPDVFALKDGILYGLEFKAERGVASVKQREFLDNMQRNGAKPYIIKNLDEIIAIFK